MTEIDEQTLPLPGKHFDFAQMPGHWLLAQLGKKVLRPGGMELTNQMLAALNVQPVDNVVEFAPGLGVTAQMTLARNPASYTAVERDEDAARLVRSYLDGPEQTCIVGQAGDTGLPSASASAIYSEAMLTMESTRRKADILQEAERLLVENGRYAIHELCLLPDDLCEDKKKEIQKELAKAIRVNARPLTPTEWRELMTSAGFQVQADGMAPMHLLAMKRFVKDEGIGGTLRFVGNLLRHPAALRRVVQMRRVFHKYQDHLGAIMLVGRKSERNAT
ncbi:MAG: SAM-dependent methyltransferase [Chloroflexi bacterium]|nr:MAG: SAM-dependent methyltransferase [Chloroflexota bacterium]PIE82533.1 MAG: SAM-dependent methyltransferase [Chloroflexota bacterium]